MQDRRGVEIQVDDLVCYPVRRGRKLEMHDAVVTEILDGFLVVQLENNGHETKLYCLDRVTVLVNYRVSDSVSPPENTGPPPRKHLWSDWKW